MTLFKISFTFETYHRSKCLERKIVLVLDFDASYFEFSKRNNSYNVCPNELYVATTRTLEHLLLFHH